MAAERACPTPAAGEAAGAADALRALEQALASLQRSDATAAVEFLSASARVPSIRLERTAS